MTRSVMCWPVTLLSRQYHHSWVGVPIPLRSFSMVNWHWYATILRIQTVTSLLSSNPWKREPLAAVPEVVVVRKCYRWCQWRVPSPFFPTEVQKGFEFWAFTPTFSSSCPCPSLVSRWFVLCLACLITRTINTNQLKYGTGDDDMPVSLVADSALVSIAPCGQFGTNKLISLKLSNDSALKLDFWFGWLRL